MPITDMEWEKISRGLELMHSPMGIDREQCVRKCDVLYLLESYRESAADLEAEFEDSGKDK